MYKIRVLSKAQKACLNRLVRKFQHAMRGKAPVKKTAIAAFSLVEVAIALVILGLIMGAVLKGKDLLDSARINALLTEIAHHRLAIEAFQEAYGFWPGDFPYARQTWGRGRDGDGDGRVGGSGLDPATDAGNVWAHLIYAQLMVSGDRPTDDGPGPICNAPMPRIGGRITLEENPTGVKGGLWFIIGQIRDKKNDGGLLTPKQALVLLGKVGQRSPTQGRVIIADGVDKPGKCLCGKTLCLEEERPNCIVLMAVE